MASVTRHAPAGPSVVPSGRVRALRFAGPTFGRFSALASSRTPVRVEAGVGGPPADKVQRDTVRVPPAEGRRIEARCTTRAGAPVARVVARRGGPRRRITCGTPMPASFGRHPTGAAASGDALARRLAHRVHRARASTPRSARAFARVPRDLYLVPGSRWGVVRVLGPAVAKGDGPAIAGVAASVTEKRGHPDAKAATRSRARNRAVSLIVRAPDFGWASFRGHRREGPDADADVVLYA